MTEDTFQRKMNWIKEHSGEQQVKAGSIVAWECLVTTLDELVGRFNDITFSETRSESKRYREVQLKKIIIGMLYEMDQCLDYWAATLNKDGLLNVDIKTKKKNFKMACDIVGLDILGNIRNNISFHFADIIAHPDAVVDNYTKVDQMSLESISRIIESANLCGFAMRDKVITSI